MVYKREPIIDELASIPHTGGAVVQEELAAGHGQYTISVKEEINPTPDDDPCGQAQPCQSSGTCVHTGPGQYQCVCSEEYEGENCTLVRTDECTPTPARM